VLHAPDSVTGGIISTVTCVSPSQKSRSICNKLSLSPPWKFQLEGRISSKTNSILPGKQCDRCCSFSHSWFAIERYMWFSTLLNTPTWSKQSLSPYWKLGFARSVLSKIYSILTGEQCACAPPGNTENFQPTETSVYHLKKTGLFGTKWASLHHENSDLKYVFLSILNWKQCARCSCS
jgi:hypothetical protein